MTQTGPEKNSIWADAIEEVSADRIEAYDYDLDDSLIAATPADQRDRSKLMVYRRAEGIECTRFGAIGDYLKAGDLLVFNATRVIPARLRVFKETGGKVELFVVSSDTDWHDDSTDVCRFECMARSNRPLREGMTLGDPDRQGFPPIEVGQRVGRHERVTVAWEGSPLVFLEAFGEIPLPPYILKQRRRRGLPEVTARDQRRYQTVYAERPGAVAAPTAGLHFTDAVLDELGENGVAMTTLDLTVGPGTFRPVDEEELDDHEMHAETYRIPQGLGTEIERCRDDGGRIIAVGTTSMRALESEARRPTPFEPGERSTDIFLRPGTDYGVCDGLITNFHLPRSTLLALVAGFVGMSTMRSIYQRAVDEDFRFYSYGDSSLLLP